MTTRRERVRQAAIQEIKSTAWEIINEQGTADVTIHGIAKRMGMTPPAFYSYFKNRDELMQGLVLDSYDSYHQALKTARDSVPKEHIGRQIMAIYTGYREWAVTNPVSFGLFAGREVPGFNPPEKKIIQKAETSIKIFIVAYQNAWQQGLLKIPAHASPLPEAYRTQLSTYKSLFETQIPEELLDIIIHIGCLSHGIISMEISGRHQHLIKDLSQLYLHQISNELRQIGIDTQ